MPITKNIKEKKSPIKIGKVLNKLEATSLLQEYTNKKTLFIKDTDDYVTVISRHPYDIIGVSTRRNWTSCIDLHEKEYKGLHLHGKFKDLLNGGGLAAYLINKEDKNITNPIARVNFRYSAEQNHIYMYETHGKSNQTFNALVRDWLVIANQKLKSLNN